MEKEFTIRDLKKLGFERREDMDFSDDGSSFKGFIYKGLPLTYLKSNGEYFISLRIDYLNELNYDEYSKMKSYELSDEFNGVSYVDGNKLVENAEAILKEYKEFADQYNTLELDVDVLVKELEKEKIAAEKILEDANNNIDIFKVDIKYSSYELTRVINYGNSLIREINNKINSLENGSYNKPTLRAMLRLYYEYNYIVDTSDKSFYVETIKNFVEKYKKAN